MSAGQIRVGRVLPWAIRHFDRVSGRRETCSSRAFVLLSPRVEQARRIHEILKPFALGEALDIC